MVIETFGFLNLFGYVSLESLFFFSFSFLNKYTEFISDFFPVVVTFLRQLPFIGTALSLPYVRDVSLIPHLISKYSLSSSLSSLSI